MAKSRVGRGKPEDGKVLQFIVDRLVDQKVSMECAVGSAEGLIHYREQFNFSLTFNEQTGRVAEIIRPEVPDDCLLEYVSDHQRFLRQEDASLAECLAAFHDSRSQLIEAVDTLPDHIYTRLSSLPHRSGCWITHFTRCFIIPSLLWPRLPSRESWHRNVAKIPRQPQVPHRVDFFLEYFEETNPTKRWKALCHRVDSYIHDIAAVAHGLFANIQIEGSGGRGRPKSAEVRERQQKVLSLHKNGMAVGKIAEEMSISVDIVKKDISRA